MKKVYLAGPMSNLPYFNFPIFFKYEKILKDKGYDVFSPAGKDIEIYGDFWKDCPQGSHEEMRLLEEKTGKKHPTYRDCLRIDLNWILDEAEAIALIPGWETSRGVKAEKALAECLDLEVINL